MRWLLSMRKRERGRNSKVDYSECTWLYLQIVVHVRHVRSITKRLDERLLRLRHASLGAQHAAQITISCNNHDGHSLESWKERKKKNVSIVKRETRKDYRKLNQDIYLFIAFLLRIPSYSPRTCDVQLSRVGQRIYTRRSDTSLLAIDF